jgi:photosystem II stability/assembly factor-like uncharacterized protein
MRRHTRVSLVAVVVAATLGVAPVRLVISSQTATEPLQLGALSWRSIGPAMFAGRVVDVAGVPGNPDILYVGSASSGLYKSINGGTTFDPVFESGTTLSIGAIAVQPDNPDVVYVGTGEGTVRNSVSYGDGLYKSVDGGRTWKRMGLEGTERFGRLVISPGNPNVVLAAAMGRAFGPSDERGIFRSTDGGVTWMRTLFVNRTTGASDVAVDPQDPSIVYAGMYDYLRQPWHFRSGGPGSGLYRSADGGSTWTKLTDPALKNGLPGSQVLGRIGVSVHEKDPRIVYTLIEAKEGGVLWRSGDRGMTWTLVNSERRINNRPFYYTQVRVDPVDPNRVYTLSGSFNVSTDGGRTFGGTGGGMFGDHHALWIDPRNPKRLLSGTDGGFFISNSYGAQWDFLNNMPMAQAYHVGIDMAEPYNVLGGFQDHEIWRGPNEKWNRVGVREGDWVRLRYMADGMHAIADPRDPDLVYYNGHFGDITRLDMRTREERYIQPYPPGPAGGGAHLEKYRFNWNSPVLMSHANPDILYYGGNVLFKTTDRGETWQAISPDLTTNDPAKQQSSGGPISTDNTRAEFHCTIVALAESPKDPAVLWAGTDDGNVQVSRDGGKTWTNVAPNITGGPKFSWVSSIAASAAEPGTAYLTVDQHRLDDFAPYIFVTTDYGKSWKRIGDRLRGYAHVVLEDPKSPNLIYVGTELGIFASLDKGTSWIDLRLGLPPLAVVDMKVHPRENDLVIGTHARGFYVLDDVTPLQEMARARPTALTLFPPVPPVRYTQASDTSELGDRVWVARNQPYGALLNYYVPQASSAIVAVADAGGREVARMTVQAGAGLNRTVWNLGEVSSCGPEPAAGRASGRAGRGRGGRSGAGGGTWVRAIPGQYTVRVSALGQTVERPLTVRADPRVKAAAEDMQVWQREARSVERTECTVNRASGALADVEAQLTALEAKAADSAVKSAVAAVRSDVRPIVLGLRGDPHDPGHLNLPGRINWLTIQVGGYSGRPTAAQVEWIAKYADQADGLVRRFEQVKKDSLSRLNVTLKAAGLPEVAILRGGAIQP